MGKGEKAAFGPCRLQKPKSPSVFECINQPTASSHRSLCSHQQPSLPFPWIPINQHIFFPLCTSKQPEDQSVYSNHHSAWIPATMLEHRATDKSFRNIPVPGEMGCRCEPSMLSNEITHKRESAFRAEWFTTGATEFSICCHPLTAVLVFSWWHPTPLQPLPTKFSHKTAWDSIYNRLYHSFQSCSLSSFNLLLYFLLWSEMRLKTVTNDGAVRDDQPSLLPLCDKVMDFGVSAPTLKIQFLQTIVHIHTAIDCSRSEFHRFSGCPPLAVCVLLPLLSCSSSWWGMKASQLTGQTSRHCCTTCITLELYQTYIINLAVLLVPGYYVCKLLLSPPAPLPSSSRGLPQWWMFLLPSSTEGLFPTIRNKQKREGFMYLWCVVQ